MFKIAEPFLENILIFWSNVSYFYVLCVLVSLVAVGLSWSLPRRNEIEFDEIENEEEVDSLDAADDLSKEKVNKKNLLDDVAQNMSGFDFEQEKEIERQQLASIFELIQKDSEKFQIGSLQELEEQMKLYRE